MARERGEHRFAPVRFRLIEAMARRSASHDGEAGRLLDRRLAELLSAYRTDLEDGKKNAPEDKPSGESADAPPRRSPVAELVDRLAQHASAAPDGNGMAPPTGIAGAPAAPDQLKTLRYFSSTWSKLSADRRLKQSLVKLPENAGPLNSHQLVHRALTLMRDVSPAYLNRFMSYVDTLSSLEQATAGNTAVGTASRADGPKKPGRGKAS